MADLNTPAGQLGNAVGGVGGNLAKAADDIVQRQMIESQLKEYFSQEQFWGTQPWFDDLKNGADFIFSKRDFDKGHQVIIKGKDQAHTLVTPKDHFNEWAKQGKNTAAAGTVAPSAARSSIPVAARSSVPIAAPAGPAATIDMLDVAKKLVPDIETGMPEDVAKAFSEGRIKTIFRTADSIPLTELSSGSESRLSGVVTGGSTYFLDEEGKIARYGRHGLGWEDARTAGSAGKDAGKSSFLDRAVFGKHSLQELDIESGKSPSEAVDDFLKQGGFTEPTLGGTLTEFDNDFSRKHKGHAVSDIYHSTGEVEFVDQLTEGESIGGKVRPKVVKANIENISIEKNLKGNITPRLKPGSAAVPGTDSIRDALKAAGGDIPETIPPGSAVDPSPDPIHPASSVATDNATKVTPLADEYDTGATAAKVASGKPVVTPPPSSVDKDMTLRTYLEELGKEKKLEAGRSTWDKKHVDFGDFHDEAFRNTADSLSLSDHVLMDSLRSNDLYQEHIALESWRDNRRWGQSPLRGDAHTGMTFDEVESRVQKNLTNFMKGTDVAPQAPSVAPTSPQSAVATETYDHGAGVSKSTASGEALAEAPPVSPKRGPGGVGVSTGIKTTPGPHGVAVTPPTTPSPPPGPPTTSPTAPTAKIVTNTQSNNLTAREALRGIGDDIKAARKPGRRLLSADGSKAMAEAVTKGIKGSRNLKMLAIGSALGLGGYTANRVANRDDTSDLEG
jgi:hypothetical protein